MQRTTIILIAVIILMIIGGYFYRSTETPSEATRNTQPGISVSPSPNQENQIQDIQSFIKSFISQKKDLKCTVNSNIQGISIEGMIYASGGKARADFSSKSQVLEITGHIITDDKYAYFWTDSSDQGAKFPLEDPQPKATITTILSPKITPKMPHMCESWSDPKPSLFILPANITFQMAPNNSPSPTQRNTLILPSINNNAQ